MRPCRGKGTHCAARGNSKEDGLSPFGSFWTPGPPLYHPLGSRPGSCPGTAAAPRWANASSPASTGVFFPLSLCVFVPRSELFRLLPLLLVIAHALVGPQLLGCHAIDCTEYRIGLQ